ncbi:MAG TPA: TMEM175 family protein [Candidatus Angelobacter sp.]|jgi:ABC-type antimicrobial peptide transport system permease subunit|nr:TMEM175 family protein [Candidatus Angelobacter sp.]
MQTETARIEAFSDGVFAIAITLLILKIKVPHYAQESLAAGLLHQWPSYMAFLLSFAYVGIMWMNHHRMFTHIKKSNDVLLVFLFRLGATLTGVLGGLGLVLAVVGVYGVMSYSVSQRTHEIGIRMALGAQRSQVLALVGRQGILVVIAGLVIGLLPAFAISQLIQDFLIGISPTDAITYTAIPILLAVVAMAACFIPARRATQVDPMLALRNE